MSTRKATAYHLVKINFLTNLGILSLVSHTFYSNELCYTMLYYVILCYAMLCYAMLCYAMLCYAMLCYTILYYNILDKNRTKKSLLRLLGLREEDRKRSEVVRVALLRTFESCLLKSYLTKYQKTSWHLLGSEERQLTHKR